MKTRRKGIIGGLQALRKARQTRRKIQQGITDAEINLEVAKSVNYLMDCHEFSKSPHCHP